MKGLRCCRLYHELYVLPSYRRRCLAFSLRVRSFSLDLHLPSYSKHFALSLRASHHSSSSSSSSAPSTPSASSYSGNPHRTGGLLSSDEHEKRRFLENFESFHELGSGSLRVHVMRAEEVDLAAELLGESFWQPMFRPVMRFLLKELLMNRRSLVPHTATLIGFYRGEDEEDELAGIVDVSFDKRGARNSSPTPTAPKNSPYIGNMAVKDTLRRMGIGWHLLKVSEELICQMSSSREVYLHCRMSDVGPFSMYRKAGYSIVKTESILVLLMLDRRKHLMCKKLPSLNGRSAKDFLDSDDEVSL